MTQDATWGQLYETDGYTVVTPRGRHEAQDGSGWSDRVTASIAGEIRRWRKIRGNLSAQQLADRCTDLGCPIQRNVIANLESGRRSAITVPELIAIAMALNVSPLLLVYPLGKDASVEVAPDKGLFPWTAIKWFTGERRPPAALLGGREQMSQVEAYREWEGAAEILIAYRRHEALVRRYRYVRDDTMTELRRLAQPSENDQDPTIKRAIQVRTDLLARDLNNAIEALRGHRRNMSDAGYQLPPLPSDVDLPDDQP